MKLTDLSKLLESAINDIGSQGVDPSEVDFVVVDTDSNDEGRYVLETACKFKDGVASKTHKLFIFKGY